MFVSIFELFKIGPGPSSSHTYGPMVAANLFINKIKSSPISLTNAKLTVLLRGSLSFTGKGHRTDQAILTGLSGYSPIEASLDIMNKVNHELTTNKAISIKHDVSIQFNPDTDIIFDRGQPHELHSNCLIFTLHDKDKNILLQETYFSIGGGFIKTLDEMLSLKNSTPNKDNKSNLPYPFATAKEMLQMAKENKQSIAHMQKMNELCQVSEVKLKERLQEIWFFMHTSIKSGLIGFGELAGGLKTPRRAGQLYKRLQAQARQNIINPHGIMDWISVYAMAVNEENAAGSMVVTAPTNGAAGVVPGVIKYFVEHCDLQKMPAEKNIQIETFLLTASAIGGLIKSLASFSGAEVGCQGEVGSASAMAAAGLCACLGGSPQQIEQAAEIALEHHLGLTCDPVGGLVQIPCIERNSVGANKAVLAASLALQGDGTHLVSLDSCIKTMMQTGNDMHSKYKETSLGGLAVNLVEC